MMAPRPPMTHTHAYLLGRVLGPAMLAASLLAVACLTLAAVLG